MSLPTAGLRRFTRHADVRQALLDPRLVFPGQAATDPTAHQAMRAAIEGALAPAALFSGCAATALRAAASEAVATTSRGRWSLPCA